MRPYEGDDFDTLVTMYEGLDKESRTRGIPPLERSRIEEWLIDILSSGWSIISLDGDEVIGHVAVLPKGADEPEGLIFVADDYQGRGIGGELLRQLLAYAAAREHDAVWLDVEASNRRAVDAFKSTGFSVEHRNISEVQLSMTMDDPVVDDAQLPPAERDE